MSKRYIQKFTDSFAISIAGICFVHCLLAPVLLVLFPVISSIYVFQEVFHEFLLLVIIPSSTVALFLGCRRHKDFSVVLAGISGLSLLFIGAFITTESKEAMLTVLGSSVMIVAHIRNFRLCSKDNCKHR